MCPTVKGKLPLSEDERKKFVAAILNAREKYPALGWSRIFKEARKVLEPGRLSEKIDHPNKLAWIKPMLGLTEIRERSRFAIKLLSDDEKRRFTKVVFDLRKNDPKLPEKFCIFEANKILPIEKQFTNKSVSFREIKWIIPMLLELDKSLKLKTSLDDEEKKLFAKNFFEFRKQYPEQGNANAIRAANAAMPEGRRIGAKIDGVKQIPWLIPLVDQLFAQEKIKLAQQEVPRKKNESPLTDEDKATFANTVYSLRRTGATWARAIREANNFLPDDRKIGATISNPTQLSWLQRALAKLEEEDRRRVVIDQRGILPKPPEEIPEPKRERKHAESRMFWNDEEKLLFAEIVYQLKIAKPGWGWPRILDIANKEMPGHRQKAKMPPSPSQIAWLPPLLDEISKRPPEKYVPDPEFETSTVVTAPAPNMDLQELMKMAFQNAAKDLLLSATQGQNINIGQLTGLIPGAAAETKPQPPAKKKVVIVGLLSAQTQNIAKRFGHKFNLKFIGANTPSQQIRDAMKHADIGILMTQFVSHSTQAAMRQHPGFNFCNGNSSALEILLEKKAAELNGH